MGDQKRFAPSARRKRQARDEGEIAKSSLLTQSVLLCSLPLLSSAFAELLQALSLWMENSLSLAGDFHTKDLLLSAKQHGLLVGFWTLALLCGGAFCALGAELVQLGFRLLLSQLWQLQRLNLVQGLSRMWSVGTHQSWPASIIRLMLLMFIWLLIMGLLFSKYVVDYLSFSSNSIFELLWYTQQALWELTLYLAVCALLVGLADLAYAKRLLNKKLRMDRQELKQEQKDTEGDPHIQSQRKQLHGEILAHQQIANVRNAKVVIID